MSNILTIFDQLSFLNTLWLFFVVFALHELEEWNIIKFERRNFIGIPPAATEKSDRMFIGFFILVGFIWCAAATLPGSPVVAVYIILPVIFFMLTNSIQHVFWSLYFKQYAPGIITAVLLLIPINCYVIFRAIQQEYVSIWYVGACTLLAVSALVKTVRAGKQMTPYVQAAHNIGVWCSEKLLKQV
jgi:hypothetical protein